ncbi:hypothetical protein SEA_LUCIVIA_3 [Mycobacterium phage Lucivia]|nr:hypothetical protein SEA_LUCIVIA_3 [Mycobacterium phage Lucivia]
MITFEQARQIVFDNLAGQYPPEADFQVATWGWENDDLYQLVAGPYAMVYVSRGPQDDEWLEDGDGPFIMVNKETGEYIEEYGEPFLIPDARAIGEPQPAQ